MSKFQHVSSDHHQMSLARGGRVSRDLWDVPNPPPPVNRQTTVKTLPSRNFVSNRKLQLIVSFTDDFDSSCSGVIICYEKNFLASPWLMYHWFRPNSSNRTKIAQFEKKGMVRKINNKTHYRSSYQTLFRSLNDYNFLHVSISEISVDNKYNIKVQSSLNKKSN